MQIISDRGNVNSLLDIDKFDPIDVLFSYVQ